MDFFLAFAVTCATENKASVTTEFLAGKIHNYEF
jgi:hypothetical protein